MKIDYAKFLTFIGSVFLLCFVSCGGGGGGGGAVANDIGVTLTTAGSATTVAPGATLTIKANVTNAANMDVTWSLAGPSNGGTVTPTTTDFADYKAPSIVTAQFTVTVTATSVQNTAKSASVVLTVLAGNYPPTDKLLMGQYAFLLQGFTNNAGPGTGIATVGSFTADGYGHLTAGTTDYYFGPTLADYAPSLGGTYTIGTDHRGTLTLTVGTSTKTFAIALGKISNGVATKGSVTETAPSLDPSTILSGSMWLQDPTAFALNKISGPYAFVFNGWKASVSYGPREALGGTLTANGTGTFNGGTLNDKVLGNSAAVTTASWTGSYGAPSTSSGRTVLAAQALTGTSGTAVMYVVGAGQMIVLISDTSSTGRVFSGQMLAQTGPFSLASLNGSCVTYQTANYDQPGYETLNSAILAMFSADGAGTLSIASYDQALGGNFYHGNGGIQYTYTIDANGQATIYSAPSIVGGKWYLTGPNTGLLLGFDIGVSVGMILPQSGGPFSAASISGSYFASQGPGGSLYSTDASGIATSTGNGALATTLDLNTAGAFLSAQQASTTFTVTSNGRAVDTNGNVIYIVSPTSFLMMNTTTWYPVIQIFEP